MANPDKGRGPKIGIYDRPAPRPWYKSKLVLMLLVVALLLALVLALT